MSIPVKILMAIGAIVVFLVLLPVAISLLTGLDEGMLQGIPGLTAWESLLPTLLIVSLIIIGILAPIMIFWRKKGDRDL